MMELVPRRLTPKDVSQVREIWSEHWGGEFIVAHGSIYYFDQVQGYVIEQEERWLGLITFVLCNEECEIISLNSFREHEGVGTQLISAVINNARSNDCMKVSLITTNDNLYALGFYQRRGFQLIKINAGAVNEARKLKPELPTIGYNNIPLRDELELEFKL